MAERRAASAVALALTLCAASAHAVEVGVGDRARPALRRVAIPEAGTPARLALAADAGAGVTEGLRDGDSAHERFALAAAATLDVTRWLNVGAWLGSRYDLHPRDSRGRDDGLLLQPELSTRLAFQQGAWGYGFEATAWAPGGADVGSSLSALSADGRVLLSGQGSGSLVSGYVGYRLDRSAKSASDVARMRFGDRIALGVSDYDALLAGVGAGHALGRTLLFAEVAAQLLLGSPKLSASPIWVSVGLRRPLGAGGLSGEVSLDALASARPDVTAVTPLFPIEPRVMLNFGIRYRFGDAQAATSAPGGSPHPAAVVPAKSTVAPLPAAPPPTSVEVELLDDRGQPLQRAHASVIQGEVETPLIETSPGLYRLDDAQPGKARLRIKAEGIKTFERDFEVSPGKTSRVDVKIEQALPAAQVRGLVRSLRGKPLAARVHVEPGGTAAQTDAEGFFQIDVSPGEYEVVIESPGYRPQRRRAKVDQQGVVIVNADLSQ